MAVDNQLHSVFLSLLDWPLGPLCFKEKFLSEVYEETVHKVIEMCMEGASPLLLYISFSDFFFFSFSPKLETH